MWDRARLTIYATFLIGGLASLAAVLGFGTYDPETYMFQPNPIDIRWLAGFVGTVSANGLAFVALLRGWGKRRDRSTSKES